MGTGIPRKGDLIAHEKDVTALQHVAFLKSLYLHSCVS